MSSESTITSFAELALPQSLQKALNDVGYETPSAIQAMTIPPLLAGRDLVGQAQTGTGKTAAFALPALANLDLSKKSPQVLVLAPTRELAIQVAEAFQKYAHHLKGFHVLPIYGGSDMRTQLRQLDRGVQVIVGTPGRVMDHIRRGSLKLDGLKTLVLDEADEMLRMGFIDDVEWILDQTPADRQIALFSATMPDAIRRIAKKHLSDPQEITIKVSTVTNASIRQRVWMTAGVHKLDALTRILEVEDHDGVIVFVRTRIATAELAEKLAARGYATAALNGDIPQQQREKTVDNLKKGRLDILVATDVAARGLDVERISHVINYDIPYDVEAYVHRIGRTGRAGRSGEAILFAANRERRLLRAIEKATSQTIEKLVLPTPEEVKGKRLSRFKQKISQTLDTGELDAYRTLVEEYQHEHGVPVIEIAAALAALAHDAKPQTSDKKSLKSPASGSTSDRQSPRAKKEDRSSRDKRPDRAPKAEKAPRVDKEHSAEKVRGDRPRRDGADREVSPPEKGMDRFRLEVGHKDQVKPGNIVGAIANEAEIDAEYIGSIKIYEDHSTVDLPEGMPKEIFKHLKSVWVSGQRLQISRLKGAARSTDSGGMAAAESKPKSKPKAKQASDTTKRKPKSKPKKSPRH
ncbi:MAG: DEAD/DEAH box helicase [Halioglobus sp.]